MPFANETTSSGHAADINRHMLQELQDAGFDEVVDLVEFGRKRCLGTLVPLNASYQSHVPGMFSTVTL